MPDKIKVQLPVNRNITMKFALTLVFAILLMVSPTGMAIEVTSAPQLELSTQVSWCATDPGMGIDEVAKGRCQFRPVTLKDLAPGFSDSAFWLRLDLYNPETKEIERWLRVGHPRLQQASLFSANIDGTWRRSNTGANVARSHRPVVASNLVLPLLLQAHEHKTFFVRVTSETTIDLTLTLWLQDAYIAEHHSIEIIHMMTMGSLLALILLSLMVYLIWRDPIYLYFSSALFFLIIINFIFSGILQTYIWPKDLPFDNRFLALAIGGLMISFVLFARQFIGELQRYRRHYWAIYFFLGGLLLAVLWACLVHYSVAKQVIFILLPAVVMSSIALIFRSWRNGNRSAGYLVSGYVILFIMVTYHFVVAFSGTYFVDMANMSNSWRILLVTPLILAGIVQRSETLRIMARRTASRLQFLAQMSHEFRTPLNIMLGYAELLERKSKRITVDEGASSIKHSGLYLLGMIDEVLDYARGEAGKLALSVAPVCWADFIGALELSTVMVLRPRGNSFQLRQEGMPDALMLDERRFRQVLDILLSNANRYTQHGNITLSCAAASVKHAQFTFSVSDTGAGIAPHELEHIFQPFVRGTAGQISGIDGTGMGLAIAHQLVTLMGGEILVESRKGGGSRFHFTIRCELAETQVRAAVNHFHGKLRQSCKVLVVDDDPENCHLLAMLLGDCGFYVITAGTGMTARRFLETQVNLVITDQFMPDGDGWSVLRDWNDRHIPVILLSAAPPQCPQGYPETVRFAHIMLKPFNADLLLENITAVLGLEWEEAAPLVPQDEAKPPPMELLFPLKLMMEEGAVTDIAEWLEHFSTQYPEYSAYGEKIAACNLALDFDALRSLISARK